MDERLVYKVTNGLESAWEQGGMKVAYRAHDWVQAPRFLANHGFDLTAFETLRAAREYASSIMRIGPIKVWAALARGTHLPPTTLSFFKDTAIQSREWQPAGDYESPIRWPLGTLMAQSIMLIEEVGEECYKCVSPQMTSCFAAGKMKVYYSPIAWARAPGFLAEAGYHLTTFATLADAQKFARDCIPLTHEVELWRASGRYPVPPPMRRIHIARASDGRVERIPEEQQEWPEGTRMYREVRLDEVVTTL